MVNLTIDGKQVTAPKDATIYEAAKGAGINIPILCHDSKLHPYGACRMCLVEVEQMKGRQIPACTTPVTEGMIITTQTPEIEAARKMVLELLLLNHPLDCPVCDKAGDCDLQNLTYDYQVNGNRFVDEKFHHEIDYANPLIERDMNRCILCGKCARICDEIVSFGAYTFINRGIETKMGTAFDGPLNCEFCGSCVSVCPVGALLARPFKFKARWWSLKKVKTVCGYCGTGCNLTLGIKDDKVLTTVYDEKQGFHRGQLCVRGRFGYQFTSHEGRLTQPLVRKNGVLEPATWDEALRTVSERLAGAKGNAASVAALAGGRLTNEEFFVFRKLFRDVIGTDNIDHGAGYSHRALTEGAVKSIGYAASPATIGDVQKSQLLLVIKTDAYDTHPVIGFEINLAIKNKGVNLAILSDKEGKLSRLPGARTFVHAPGAEIAVLNAITKIILDDGLASSAVEGVESLKSALADYSAEKVAAATGISVEALKELAAEYAKAEKALIIVPLGQGYPSHNAQLANAVLNLAIITGKIGSEGCGVLFMPEKNNSQGGIDMGIYPQAGGKTAEQIIAGCADGSIKTLLIAGENPVVSYPNRKQVEAALDAVDFLVVQDLFLTETAAKADVVLPVASFAEKEGTFTSVERKVQRVHRAVKPVGSSRSDFEIFNTLLASVAGASSYASPMATFDALKQEVPAYAAIDYNSLGEEGTIWQPLGSKNALVPATGKTAAAEAGKYALVTGSVLYHCGTLSLYGKGPTHVCPETYAEINHADARALKVESGDEITLKSDNGTIKAKVRATSRIPAGMVFVPYHFAVSSVNTLTSGNQVTWITISK